MEQKQTNRLPFLAQVFVAFVVLAAATSVTTAFRGWTPVFSGRFFLYALIAIASSGMKISIPGIDGNLSVNHIFTLLTLVELDRPQALLLGLLSAVVQTLWKTKRKPRLVQLIFNLSCIALTVSMAALIFNQPWFRSLPEGEALRLGAAGTAYFLINTLCVSIVIGLSEKRKIQRIWRGCYVWTFPYYMVGVSLAEMVHTSIERLGWRFTVALVPLLYLIYRSFRLYLDTLEHEKVHNADMAALHLRTIEALAMAIDAKDECTQEHLRRVQVYSESVAKIMGLPEDEILALRTAAFLHDIGKLAVPDYIISKPGKLTPEEFEKMKIHTVVGAAILQQVGFPYAVAPIVRSHHERWDGSGYPDGLKGEEIPIGARVLSAVDYLDAISSDRQYRRALPMDEAIECMAALAGRSFDPKVVEVLKLHYKEFEKLTRQVPLREVTIPKDLVVNRGCAPDAGFQNELATASSPKEIFMASIMAARQEVQAVLELTEELNGALRLDEMLAVVADRVKQLIPFDCIALYLRDGHVLRVKYASGEGSRALSSVEIPVGQGLSGWVVENNKPILNGNPAVERGHSHDAAGLNFCKSALSVPLSNGDAVLGALTLYHSAEDAYNKDHIRVMLAISGKIARAVVSSIQFQQAQSQAHTDELTGLPNARSVCLHLQNELARAEASGRRVTVLVCDLDGFKSVNDTYGHLVGNRLLQRVSRILQASCREYDYVGRLGGNEFLMMFAGDSLVKIDERLAEIDRLVRQAGVELCRNATIGISIGCASFPEDGADAEALLSHADSEMYAAKRERKTARRPAELRLLGGQSVSGARWSSGGPLEESRLAS